MVLREPSENETVNKIDAAVNATYEEVHKIGVSLEKLQKAGLITGQFRAETDRHLLGCLLVTHSFTTPYLDAEEMRLLGPTAYQLMRKCSENIRRKYEIR